MKRTDAGKKIRARKCDFCSAPPGAQHDSLCIFGEHGRFPTQGVRKGQETGVIVSDVDDGRVAAIADGLDIWICSPRDAEALLKVLPNGPLLKREYEEALDRARRADEWAAIT